MNTKNYEKFYNEIVSCIPKQRVITDPLLTLAYGTDASFYRLIPEIVIKVANENEVSSVIKVASELKIPLTFRAAGTSLSGQAITNSVLVVTDNSWNKVSVSDSGEKITLQPSVIGSHANARLNPFHKKLGPDPASINSCKIAGIAANNASGMTSGTKFNIYNTLLQLNIFKVCERAGEEADKH